MISSRRGEYANHAIGKESLSILMYPKESMIEVEEGRNWIIVK